MEKTPTWRVTLANIIRNAGQRQHIAAQLNIHPVTLTRWATGKSNPRPAKLHSLLSILQKQEHAQAGNSLAQTHSLHSLQTIPGGEIPSEFYRQVLSTYTTLPSTLREWSLNILILQQILSHLDPRELGMHVFLAYCNPPAPGQTIRSLRKIAGRGTAPWSYTDERSTQFFGAESLVGQAILRGHPLVVYSQEDLDWSLSDHSQSSAKSTCVFPLLRANQVIGSLCIMSTQPRFFSQFHLDLLQHYTNLLVITCEDKTFFQHEDVILGVIPPLEQQIPILQSFQKRVMLYLNHANRQHRFFTKNDVEQLIWQAIEDELLTLANTKAGQGAKEKNYNPA